MARRQIRSRREIMPHLEALNVEPFREFLGDLLAAGPSQADIQQWSKKSVDRYAQALVLAAKLSGYTPDSPKTVNNILVQIGQLSDMELQQELDRQLAIIEQRVIEHD